MTTYTWSITEVTKEDQDDLQGVITALKYRLEATDGKHVVDTFGEVTLTSPNPVTFIAFQFLSKKDIEVWIEGIVDAEAMKQELNEKLKRMQDA